MAKMQDAQLFGGIGTLLMIVGFFIPYIWFVGVMVGSILVLIAVKHIADFTGDKQIFDEYLLSFIITILTIVTIISLTFFSFTTIGGFNTFQGIETQEYYNLFSFWNEILSLLYACAIGLLIGWILMIIGALYFKRSYHRIAKQTDVELFKTAGTMYFIGALSLIFLVGFLIIFIAKIIEINAYFSLPKESALSPPLPQGRRCTACGRLIPEDAVICPYCGKSFQQFSSDESKHY